MGFLSNLFGGGDSTLKLPQPYKAAPRNIVNPANEYNRLYDCFNRIIEDNGWFDGDYLSPFLNAYRSAAHNYNKMARFPSLYQGGDLGAALYDRSKPLFAAFSPFYDNEGRFYRPFGLIAGSYLQGLEEIPEIYPDSMKYLIYYNPDGQSVLVDYVNRRWIDGRVFKVYKIN